MGSKSSKSTTSSAQTSTSTTTETINANSTDNEGVSVIADGAVTLNITPGEAFTLAGNAITALRETSDNALRGAREFAEGQNKEVLDFATQNANPSVSTFNNIIKYSTLAAVAYAGLKIFKKG